ncbi:MAG: hypothetical protein PUK21_03965 [Peptostreptococcaceae bacterium]|nr:hypothetical protein [Peptostreptococcaceae bacterium]MDY5739403.1 hypothetical protein [Anaerovoracaceae bacterium]
MVNKELKNKIEKLYNYIVDENQKEEIPFENFECDCIEEKMYYHGKLNDVINLRDNGIYDNYAFIDILNDCIYSQYDAEYMQAEDFDAMYRHLNWTDEEKINHYKRYQIALSDANKEIEARLIKNYSKDDFIELQEKIDEYDF